MIKIDAASQKVLAWKNGGGKTREIVLFPSDATFETFDWRISTAQIDRGGPFSLFPGIDRSLALLEGSALTLHIEGCQPTHLKQGAVPVTFAGELSVISELAGEGVHDFNVMTRRERCSHSVSLVRVNGELKISRSGDAVIIYLAEDSSVDCLAGQGGHVELCQGDAVIFYDGDGNDIGLSSSCAVNLFITRIKRKRPRQDSSLN